MIDQYAAPTLDCTTATGTPGSHIKPREPAEEYQSIISKHATEGWRLIQIFSPAWDGWQPYAFDIIFERRKPEIK